MTKTATNPRPTGRKKGKPASGSELQAQEALVRRIELQLDAARSEVKVQKDLLESAIHNLRRMVRGDDPELFDEETGEVLA